MDRTFEFIVSHFKRPRDLVVFGSLSKSTRDAVSSFLKEHRLLLTVTPRTNSLGMTQWLRRHGACVGTLKYKRSVFSPITPLPNSLENLHTLEFWWCRVCLGIIYAIPDLSKLKRLVIHQVDESRGGGLTHVVQRCQNLEELSMTFSNTYDIVSFGPVNLPKLRRLNLRGAHIMYIQGPLPESLTNVSFHASYHLSCRAALPMSCESVEIDGRETFFIEIESLFASDHEHTALKKFTLRCIGVLHPSFFRKMPCLEAFECSCDSFMITQDLFLAPLLKRFVVNVKTCFVCSLLGEDQRSRLEAIEEVHTTSQGIPVHLGYYFDS